MESKSCQSSGGGSMPNAKADQAIHDLLTAESAEISKMVAFLKHTYHIDNETISSIRESTHKCFLMSMIRPGSRGAGICLASRSWLDFCGFGETDVAWRQPKDLLQGALTQKKHKQQLGEYFASFDTKEGAENQPLRMEGLVNYRHIWDDGFWDSSNDDEEPETQTRVPFKFTLTVRQLQSRKNGTKYPLFDSVMTDEIDLTRQEIQQLQEC